MVVVFFKYFFQQPVWFCKCLLVAYVHHMVVVLLLCFNSLCGSVYMYVYCLHMFITWSLFCYSVSTVCVVLHMLIVCIYIMAIVLLLYFNSLCFCVRLLFAYVHHNYGRCFVTLFQQSVWFCICLLFTYVHHMVFVLLLCFNSLCGSVYVYCFILAEKNHVSFPFTFASHTKLHFGTY